MTLRSRLSVIILLLSFLPLCLAATHNSFCKCTCFTSSKLIPLDGGKASNPDVDGKVKTRSCLDCNKQFCLDYNLPICSDAKEADVQTTCFQRDSTKDQLVVYIFIFVTAGLLIWAAAKPAVEKWQLARTSRQAYVPVDGREDGR